MQMYKIITLGQGFIFINAKAPININEGPIGKKIDHESVVITVSQSLKYDYSISLSNNIFVQDFDVLRALMIYIYSVKGMPNAEYEIFFENDNKLIVVSGSSKKLGGCVEKCKLLSTNNAFKDENGSTDIYEIEIDKERYIGFLCDNINTVDLSRVISRFFAERRSCASFCGAIAVAPKKDEALIATRNLSGTTLFGATAFAAAYQLLYICLGVSPRVIRNENGIAFCELSSSEIYVYDLAPKVYRII